VTAALVLPLALAPFARLLPALAADMPTMPAAKREAPAEVTPVVVGNLRIEALHWGRDRGLEQDGGYLVAYDVKTGEEAWTLEVYHTDYDEKLERDVQDVFIVSLAVDDGDVIVTDEDGRRFRVDIASRAVTPL
jgi:hypothetical protein